jgi:hypothetical protein
MESETACFILIMLMVGVWRLLLFGPNMQDRADQRRKREGG